MKLFDYYLFAGMLDIKVMYRKLRYGHDDDDTKWSAFLALCFTIAIFFLSIMFVFFPLYAEVFFTWNA